MTFLQLEMPPVAAGTSCATVNPKLVRPVTLAPEASRTVNTTVGLMGAEAGMVTASMVAKFRERATEDTALCSVMSSAICPVPWQRLQVSCVSAADPPSGGDPASAGVPGGPAGPAGPSFPAGPAQASAANRATAMNPRRDCDVLPLPFGIGRMEPPDGESRRKARASLISRRFL